MKRLIVGSGLAASAAASGAVGDMPTAIGSGEDAPQPSAAAVETFAARSQNRTVDSMRGLRSYAPALSELVAKAAEAPRTPISLHRRLRTLRAFWAART